MVVIFGPGLHAFSRIRHRLTVSCPSAGPRYVLPLVDSIISATAKTGVATTGKSLHIRRSSYCDKSDVRIRNGSRNQNLSNSFTTAPPSTLPDGMVHVEIMGPQVLCTSQANPVAMPKREGVRRTPASSCGYGIDLCIAQHQAAARLQPRAPSICFLGRRFIRFMYSSMYTRGEIIGAEHVQVKEAVMRSRLEGE
jgi:hypothetical protein